MISKVFEFQKSIPKILISLLENSENPKLVSMLAAVSFHHMIMILMQAYSLKNFISQKREHTISSRYNRHFGFNSCYPGSYFITHLLDNMRGRSNEANAAVNTCLGKVGAF